MDVPQHIPSRLDVFPLPRYDLTGGRIIITSPFGPRREGYHFGVDLGSTDGIERVEAYAPADGKIVRTSRDPGVGAGLNLWFETPDGRRWKFFHLDAVLAPVNVALKAGTVIARIGNSGTGAVHLHIEEHAGPDWNSPIDLTPAVRECMEAGRFVGEEPPAPTPVPITPVPEEDDVIPVVLKDADTGARFLWAGGVPAPAGDVQIQYATTLWGKGQPLSEFVVNGAFISELRG